VLRVHTSDGLTVHFDLSDEEQVAAWLERTRDPRFQDGITGMTVSHRGVLYSVVKPQGFRSVSYLVESIQANPSSKNKGGERIYCFADEVRVGMMVHRAQRAVRVTLTKTGRRRFDPEQR